MLLQSIGVFYTLKMNPKSISIGTSRIKILEANYPTKQQSITALCCLVKVYFNSLISTEKARNYFGLSYHFDLFKKALTASRYS